MNSPWGVRSRITSPGTSSSPCRRIHDRLQGGLVDGLEARGRRRRRRSGGLSGVAAARGRTTRAEAGGQARRRGGGWRGEGGWEGGEGERGERTLSCRVGSRVVVASRVPPSRAVAQDGCLPLEPLRVDDLVLVAQRRRVVRRVEAVDLALEPVGIVEADREHRPEAPDAPARRVDGEQAVAQRPGRPRRRRRSRCGRAVPARTSRGRSRLRAGSYPKTSKTCSMTCPARQTPGGRGPGPAPNTMVVSRPMVSS